MFNNWLNTRRNNRDAILDQERTRAETSRITQAAKTSRMTVTRQPNIVLTVTKTAHGFTPGQAVYYTLVSGSQYWNLASALNVLGDIIGGSGLAENYIGVVVAVPTADTFRVAMSGMMSIGDPTFLAALSATQCYYCLSGTAGTLVAGLGSGSGYYPGRAVVFSHGNNLYEFISPALQSSHDHNITKFVSQTSHGFSVGDWVNTTYAKATVANSSGLPVGMVVEVMDANTFKVCFQGVINWPGGLGALVMFLTTGTAGTISATTSTRPVAWSANFGADRVYIDGLSGTVSGVMGTLEQLADYGGLGPGDGDILKRVSGAWHSVVPVLSILEDVSVPSPADGDVLTFNYSLGLWEAVAGAPGTLAGLSDVALASPTDQQALLYDAGSSKWVNGTVATSLASLTDVVITSGADGDLLMWNGTDWVNVPRGTTHQVFAAPVTGSGDPSWRVIDPRDLPRQQAISANGAGSSGPSIAFDYSPTATTYWMTGTTTYSDLIGSPPTTEHFDWHVDSSAGFGSDTGLAFQWYHTRDNTYRKIVVNRDMQMQISLGDATHTRTVTLRLDQILDLVGTDVSGSAPANMDIRPRMIPICVGGVAKNVIVMASADF